MNGDPTPTCRLIICTTRQIDPAEYDTRNDISHYTVDGQTLWSQAYTYCSGDPSSPIECDEGARFVEAVEQTLPEYLSDADGGSQTSATYQMQVTHLRGYWCRMFIRINRVLCAAGRNGSISLRGSSER